jgi:hypothetical protein
VLTDLFHQLSMVATAFFKHLGANGMDFGHDRVFVKWLRHIQKTP